MGVYEGQDTRPSRGLFSGFTVVLLASVLLVVGGVTFFYTQCTADFWRDDWLYPEAELVSETSQFLSTQQRIFFTTDRPETIEAWYRQRAAELTRAAVVSGNFSADYSPPPFQLVADPQRNGTRIVFTRTCPDW
ncbi:MAG: hypothetical protein IPK19_29340 [Chloroflexi bacterium]|nr:hypothetical protein [Chloroflexota bacterium]